MSRSAPVSVVVPTHNGERYVGEAIESVLAQTLRPREILVVDDGSTDRGADVAAAFGDLVRVLRQPKSGAASARNRGVEAATQPFLAFLDHDDLWLPEKTEWQIALLDAKPEYAGTFGHMTEFASPELPAEVASRLRANATSQASTLISCLLVRTDAFRRVGPLAETSQSDFVDWYLRAKDLGLRFDMLPRLVVRRRVHDANTSRDARVKRDYLKHIKASLDRRRGGDAGGG